MEATNDNTTVKYTTTQEACNILVNLLLAHGVRHTVVSPGSRNAPIIIALSQCEQISKHIVVDERSAAFIALGIAQQENKPVALVCTSGTAVLNYAPAVAEAYYQHLPLIIISADRPHEWIDQNDSQTIKQHGILGNIVKSSFDIPANIDTPNSKWYVNRCINEAMIIAEKQPTGPIHLNIQFNEPLYDRKALDNNKNIRVINNISLKQSLEESVSHTLAENMSMYKKVLVLASMNKPNKALSYALNELAGKNIVVLTEIISNSKCNEMVLGNIDRLLTEIDETECGTYAPDLLITIGGSPVSRQIKTLLRKHPAKEHWRIGFDNTVVDTIQNLTHRIETEPADFFTQLSPLIENKDNRFYQTWLQLSKSARNSHISYIENAPWSDLKAMDIIMQSLPISNLNLQISNGSAIRYVDILGTPKGFSGDCHCNRGVSGIDGSTSTALGASMSYAEGTTLLITGDMSFSYDLSGLASQYNNRNFKIIVLCNGGGGIFRFINGPSELPEFEKYFEVHRNIPINLYAKAFGFQYFEANDKKSLITELNNFHKCDSASILAVYTDGKISADVLKGYFKRNK